MYTDLVPVTPDIVRCEDGAVQVDVADVKKLHVRQSVRTATGQVGSHVVELTEFLGELDVAFIVEAGAAEDTDAVL